MVAPAYFTWDFVLPSTQLARAASLTDLGDAQLVDDPAEPPIPPQMPYSAQLNQWALQLSGMNRIIPALDLEIQFVAGNPTVINAAAMSSILTVPYITTPANGWQIVHVASGIVLISWPAGSLPPPRAKARAWITDINPYPQPVVEPQSNGVKVHTWNLAGTQTDLPFVVSIY